MPKQAFDYLYSDEWDRTPTFNARSVMIGAMLVVVGIFNGFLFVIGLDKSPGSMAGPAVFFIGPIGNVVLALLLLALAPILRLWVRPRSMIPYLIASLLAPVAGFLLTIAALAVFS